MTMHATWRRQWSRRIQYQPSEIKTVLVKLSDALIAGRSEIVTPQIYTDGTQMKEGWTNRGVRNLCKSVFICGSLGSHE